MEAMRDVFINELCKIAEYDKQIVLLSDDFGAPSLDKFREKYNSTQFFSIGVAEQNLINIAAGLALEGKNVFVYMISSFISRCYEQIKLNLCAMNLPVTILGIGAGFSYDIDGLTHHSLEDLSILNVLPNITILNISTTEMIPEFVKFSYRNKNGPLYIRMDRKNYSLDYSEENSFCDGFTYLGCNYPSLTIITTGTMVHKALEVSNKLKEYWVTADVIDIYRIKPINKDLLLDSVASKKILVLEENFNTLGKEISYIFSNKNVNIKYFNIPNFCFENNTRNKLHKSFGIDVDTIVKGILAWT